MKISEAAEASGCPLETIRYYERIGLLDKAVRRSNGYRDYRPVEVRRLRFITRGRQLGFSLDEIRSLLQLAEHTNMPCKDIDRLARAHLADVQERIARLEHMARELKRTITTCAGGVRARCAILEDLQSPPEVGQAGRVPRPAKRKAEATKQN